MYQGDQRNGLFDGGTVGDKPCRRGGRRRRCSADRGPCLWNSTNGQSGRIQFGPGSRGHPLEHDHQKRVLHSTAEVVFFEEPGVLKNLSQIVAQFHCVVFCRIPVLVHTINICAVLIGVYKYCDPTIDRSQLYCATVSSQKVSPKILSPPRLPGAINFWTPFVPRASSFSV